MRNHGSQRGAGLTELIILLVVIAVLTSVTMPAVKDTLESCSLEASAGSFVRQLFDARMAAIRLNRETSLKIDPAGGTMRISTPEPGSSGTAVFLPGGVKFAPDCPAEIRIDTAGRPVTPYAVTLELPKSRRQKKLEISVSGKISNAAKAGPTP